MILDYNNFDSSTVNTIKAIENKGHVRYIRYLLSKKIPPVTIRKELARLALSAPDKSTMSVYFTNIILPLVEKYGLMEYYKEYYTKLIGSESENEILPVLNFDIAFTDRDQDRVSFCGFIRELEIEEMWSREIVRYYGGIHNIPQNEDGERVIKVNPARSVESILTCPRKYVIDKLILEGVSAPRIVRYIWDKYQIKIDEATMYSYLKYFFSYERKEIEEMIEQLISEQTSLKSELDIIENNDSYSLGDKLAISQQYQEKIDFLEEIIKDLTAKYTDLTYQQALTEKVDTKAIIDDIIQRGYERFKLLDRSRDRDVVKPITDVSKMIFSAIDKKNVIADNESKAKRTMLERDKSASEILIEMYNEAYDRHMEIMNSKLEVSEENMEEIDIIEGLDEV